MIVLGQSFHLSKSFVLKSCTNMKHFNPINTGGGGVGGGAESADTFIGLGLGITVVANVFVLMLLCDNGVSFRKS